VQRGEQGPAPSMSAAAGRSSGRLSCSLAAPFPATTRGARCEPARRPRARLATRQPARWNAFSSIFRPARSRMTANPPERILADQSCGSAIALAFCSTAPMTSMPSSAGMLSCARAWKRMEPRCNRASQSGRTLPVQEQACAAMLAPSTARLESRSGSASLCHTLHAVNPATCEPVYVASPPQHPRYPTAPMAQNDLQVHQLCPCAEAIQSAWLAAGMHKAPLSTYNPQGR